MKYLHEEPYMSGNENIWEGSLIKRWANDVWTEDEEGYKLPKYYLHKIGTDEYYPDPVDVKNEKRIELGLKPYEYEISDKLIEQDAE